MEDIFNGAFTQVLVILLAFSEALALIPAVGSNGIIQGVIQILKKLLK